MYERKKRPPGRKTDSRPEPVPARTEEEEIKRACGYAMDLALKQLREGTASSQIICHFLKLDSPKERAEVRKTEKDIELANAKIQAIKSAEEQDKKYDEVIKAISAYAGHAQEWEVVEDDYPEY